MRYEKPSVILVAEAEEAIQSSIKGMLLTEAADPTGRLSTGAYEADE